jgi:branched-chain amino acid transport system substrate-binding protein
MQIEFARLVYCAVLVASAGTATAQDNATIRIGLISPLTGVQAAIGAQQRNGAVAAVNYYNAQGGVLGRKLELVMRDSQFTPAGAAAAARDLAQQNIVAVIGDISPASSAAQYPIMNQAGIPMFTPTPAKKDLNPAVNPMLFPSAGPGEYIAWSAADYLVGTLKLKKICSIGDLSVASRMAPMATEYLKGKGTAFAASETYQNTATDVTVQLKALKDGGCEGLAVWAYGPPLITLARGLEAIDWHPPAAGMPGIADPHIIEAVGAPALKNFYADIIGKAFLLKRAGDPANPRIAPIVEWYGKLDPKLAGLYEAVYGWDATTIIVQALKQAGKAEPRALVDALESGTPFQAVRGTFTFSKTDHTGIQLSDLGLAQGGVPPSAGGALVAAPGVLD